VVLLCLSFLFDPDFLSSLFLLARLHICLFYLSSSNDLMLCLDLVRLLLGLNANLAFL
jgi:hypothetical protein